MAKFYPLIVKDIRKETPDTVSVAFEIPEHAKQEFDYVAGQYLPFKFNINGEEIRRSYSLSSSPLVDDEYRIAVKQIKNGKASTFLNNTLKVGDEVESMPPDGNFILNPSIDSEKHYVAFAAGSGITPIMSILKTVLHKEPKSKFTLVFGNRTTQDIIYKNELDALKNEFSDRFQLLYVLSRENSGNELLNGRIDSVKASEILGQYLTDDLPKEYFLCGPEDMIMSVSKMLEDEGVNKEVIHYELFTTPTQQEPQTSPIVGDFSGTAKVTIIVDDEPTEIDLASDGINILDAAMDAGIDAPFSCKGAVCCTCKAQVKEGKAVMDMNYALSDAEVEDGFILTCQAHPASEKVVVDFDVI